MSELVSIITCTGFRPEALALCEKYILRQTWKSPIEWIIVDDSIPVGTKFGAITAEPYPNKIDLGLPFEQKQDWQKSLRNTADIGVQEPYKVEVIKNVTKKVYAGPVPWTPGINTQRPNMHEALKHVTGEYIFCFEDEDHYRPEFIEQLVWLMQKYVCAGENNNRYYNIKERMYKYWGNIHHSSLCSTGLRKEALKQLYEAVNSGELFMDMSFWRKCFEQKIKAVLFHGTNLGVGIKGVPGRMGIGSGHHSLTEQGFISDPGYQKLIDWIGLEDAKVYMKMSQDMSKEKK